MSMILVPFRLHLKKQNKVKNSVSALFSTRREEVGVPMASAGTTTSRYCFAIYMIFLSIRFSLSCPADHRDALLQFKSLDMEKPSKNSSLETDFCGFRRWNASDCCTCEGVSCDTQSPLWSVTALGLPGLFASPSPAASADLSPLFAIKTLTSLDLSSNSIQGEIPKSVFANLANLTFLDLSMNDLTGSILSEIFSLRNLQVLNLNSNFFAGNLSREITDLVNLQELNLEDNSFTGIITTEIGNLSKLQYLSLRHNQFSRKIPESIFRLKEVQVLILDSNNLSSTISNEIGNLSNLYALSLWQNNFSGEIPTSISKRINLELGSSA